MVPIEAGVRILLGLLPVFLFLIVLILLDSYKLVRPLRVVVLIAAGALAATGTPPPTAGAEDIAEEIVEDVCKPADVAEVRGAAACSVPEAIVGSSLPRIR